ncbi:MAG: matrixin family metalloprotease [Isosphaeraceae bacterium]
MAWVVSIVMFACGAMPSVVDDDPAPAARPVADFLVIPLRLHVLTAEGMPEVDCKLSDEDLKRILRKVNRIWHKAGIHWGLEAIIREPAARLDRFREAPAGRSLTRFRLLAPDASRKTDGLHVFYLHDLPVNGVWMGTNFALVRETASLRQVEGGIDEPIPRVTAHELGHALGLQHRQDRTNLLASGTTGTSLNEAEIETARRRARSIPGSLTVESLEQAAAKAETGRAKTLHGWLAEIPGAEARAAALLKQLESTTGGDR